MSEEKKKDPSGQKKEEKKKGSTDKTFGSRPLDIPLRIIPNEKEEIAQEMRDLFDEDKVVHRQGSSEPEAD